MKDRFALLTLILFLSGPLFAQQNNAPEPDRLSAEDILLKQALTKRGEQNSNQSLNERMQSLVRAPRTATDYLLGPGDVIELTVVGIPGLEKKVLSLDGEGMISVPYLGQVEVSRLSTRDVESTLARLFAVSLLEDPQVTVAIKEHKSQYFYVMGAVRKPDRFALAQSTDVLDALALAGGLTEKADTTIKIYRYSQQQPADSSKPAGSTLPSNALEVNLTDLLESGHEFNRMEIISGDVIEVPELKERNYYVLGDVLKPGAFSMRPNENMVLSQALGNAGGVLRTASGKNTTIIRPNKSGEGLPEKIKVNAYALLKGEIRDIQLLENDIVVVPGSASKTLGKSFLSGVSGVLTTLLVIGAH